MQPENIREEVLDKILKSKQFAKSPASKVLLKFLIQSTIKKVDLKESVIGLHIFGDRYDGEKSNARIRVSVYHLRKKLEQYYNEEGLNDKFKLSIDKGQYQVQFIRNDKEKEIKKKPLLIHLVYISIIITILVSYLLIHRYTPLPFWNTFLSNKKETLMYIGDVYGYLARTTTGTIGWQRDYDINSDEDLKRRKSELGIKDNEIRRAEYSYTTASEVDAVKTITNLFSKEKKDFTVRLASNVDVKNLKEQNIIYVGPIKTDNRFVQLLTENFHQFRFNNNKLYLIDSNLNEYLPVNQKYKSELSSSRPSEIAIVTSIKTIHNTQQLLFFSDHDMGVRATVEFFTKKETLNKFVNTSIEVDEDFTAIFIVNGEQRVDFGMKLLEVFKRDKSYK